MAETCAADVTWPCVVLYLGAFLILALTPFLIVALVIFFLRLLLTLGSSAPDKERSETAGPERPPERR